MFAGPPSGLQPGHIQTPSRRQFVRWGGSAVVLALFNPFKSQAQSADGYPIVADESVMS
jgi:hypothetical protein